MNWTSSWLTMGLMMVIVSAVITIAVLVPIYASQRRPGSRRP
jgi:uncharacterized membrane protein